MTHHLKTIQPFFEAIFNEEKHAELRLNDRNFQVGDEVALEEYNSETSEYGDRVVRVIITHILSDFEGLTTGWVMFSFDVLEKITWKRKCYQIVKI